MQSIIQVREQQDAAAGSHQSRVTSSVNDSDCSGSVRRIISTPDMRLCTCGTWVRGGCARKHV